MFSVLAFGTTQDWSRFVFRTAAAALLIVWAIAKQLEKPWFVAHNPLFGPIALMLVISFVQLGLGTTAYRYATVSELLQQLAYASIFVVVCNSWQRETDRYRVLSVLAVFGFAVAAFAILQGLTSKGELYWAITPHFGGAVYGPYVNRNHYAGLMELLAPVPFALAAIRGRKVEQRAVLIFAGIVMGISIFASQSRAGMASFAFEMLILCIVLLRIRRSIRTEVAIAFGAAIFLAFVFVFGGSELFQRFSSVSDLSRFSILKDSLRMIWQKPVLGWGLGTFPTVYPHFRSFYTDAFVNQAHNDVIQFVVENGVVGLVALVWFVVALCRNAVRSITHWTGSESDAARLAGLIGCTGLGFHSFFDFNLHIPANALAFFIFCALATIRGSSAEKLRISAD